jgi:hypothetical protein
MEADANAVFDASDELGVSGCRRRGEVARSGFAIY